MRQLAVGGVVGLVLGAALVQPMTAVFFDVRPSDPTVYAAIVLTMGVSGLLACIVPARRATRVSPVRALTGGWISARQPFRTARASTISLHDIPRPDSVPAP
jgi:hypothetical protein